MNLYTQKFKVHPGSGIQILLNVKKKSCLKTRLDVRQVLLKYVYAYN